MIRRSDLLYWFREVVEIFEEEGLLYLIEEDNPDKYWAPFMSGYTPREFFERVKYV